MILGMYSIYDKYTGYMVPAYQQSDEQARRMFAYDVNHAEMSVIKVNPDDFQLEKVGTFDTDTGHVTVQKPEVIVTARQVLQRKDNE